MTVAWMKEKGVKKKSDQTMTFDTDGIDVGTSQLYFGHYG